MLTLLALFVALQIGVGLWVARRVRAAADFFVAGRRLPAPLVFATFLAANIGAGSTIGAASLGYTVGLGGWWWNGSAGLGSLVFAAWAGPRLWRLAKERGFFTLGDFLEWRYGRTTRAVSSVIIWTISLSILAGQLLGASSILQVVAGLPPWAGAVTASIVVSLYFVAGGLLTSAWVNVVQLAVKLTGFAIAFPLALSAAGGWTAIRLSADIPATFLSPVGNGGSALWLLPLLAPAFIVSPGLVQKAYGAVDDNAVRVGVGASAVVLILFAILPVGLGMAARVLHPHLPSADQALPTLLSHDLPPWVGALTLAGVFGAEISAADAVLFMLSTSLSLDIYRRFLSPSATDARMLAVARGSAIVATVAGLAMAMAVPTVVDALKIFYSILTVALAVPVIGGLLWRRPDERSALAAMVAGVATTMIVTLGVQGGSVAGWPPVALGLLAAAVAFALSSTVARTR